jgi:valyl-tRNA synthetase
MSKSKGNVIDPLDIVDGIGLEELVAKRVTGLMQPKLAPAIERSTRRQYPQGIAAHGTDALRFTFAALATQSRDLSFDLGRVEGYRNFCNKLWNAARFVLMAAGSPVEAGPEAPSPYDRWIRSRLDATVAAVRAGFAAYRFDLAAQAVYEFTWYEFCDWYLEFSKTVMQSPDAGADQRRGTRRVLLETLETLLRLLHPLMPFITEEIWLRVAPLAGMAGDSIMRQPYPAVLPGAAAPEVESEIRWVMDFILGVRRIRGELDIAPSVPFELRLQNATPLDLERYARNEGALRRLAGIVGATPLAAGEAAPQAAAALLGDLRILVPMAGLIDVGAELARLDRRRSKIEQELARADAKLGNENFIRNAPAAVVTQERERVLEFKRELAQLAEQYERVASLR